jgi:hypothetical protein
MHANSVLATRPVLSAAAYPCFTSSDAVVNIAPAPRDPPAVAKTTVRLLVFPVRNLPDLVAYEAA